MNQVAENWKDYECIDTGHGEKLERWKDIILRRPDPQTGLLQIKNNRKFIMCFE